MSEMTAMERERRASGRVTAFRNIPYALISQEIDTEANAVLAEFTKIGELYNIYRDGMEFTTEGSNGDYVPATLKYKLAASLVNKQARFLFAECPDIVVAPKADAGKITPEAKQSLTNHNDLLSTILTANNFENGLFKAAKDCFIGKRVAACVNFNEDDGVSVTFYPSTQFVYQTKVGNPHILEKFVCFTMLRDSQELTAKEIFRKKYELVDGTVYVEEAKYDGTGKLLEVLMERQPILLDRIPAFVFVNDGLTGDERGISDIEELKDFEYWYSRLSNADKDAERKSMNPIRYTVDMDSLSTEDLGSSAGSYWDLQSEQNNQKATPKVGVIEASMAYATSLEKTLRRIKSGGFDLVDVPNIDIESMAGTITTGKALKALYWGLVVRCKEKMKTWGPGLRYLAEVIIEGSRVYPDTVKKYITETLTPVDYEIKVEQNLPLPEDEFEEKNMDLAQVDGKTMSRRSYMKKWYKMTNEEVDEELEQIALEEHLINNRGMPPTGHTILDM